MVLEPPAGVSEVTYIPLYSSKVADPAKEESEMIMPMLTGEVLRFYMVHSTRTLLTRYLVNSPAI